MYYFYVLKSLKNGKLYFGSTSDLRKRRMEHNNGSERSTRHGVPWKIVYYEAFSAKSDAIKREKQIKKFKSAYGFLKRRIRNSLEE